MIKSLLYILFIGCGGILIWTNKNLPYHYSELTPPYSEVGAVLLGLLLGFIFILLGLNFGFIKFNNELNE